MADRRKKVKVSNKGKCSVAMYCNNCSTHYELTGFSSEQNERLYNRDASREKIQDIIPEVEPKWRELFISRICPECWEKMFG